MMVDWVQYIDTVQSEAREIWKEVFSIARYDTANSRIDDKSIDDAVKLANKSVDAYLKKCTKLATGDWISKSE